MAVKQVPQESILNIAKIRLIEMGMTQTELAQQVGLSPQNLWRILDGRRPGKKYISKIKKILNIKDVA